MKLFIPACGDRIVLVEPWTFLLYFEDRNVDFAKTQGLLPEKAPKYGHFEDGGYAAGYKKVAHTLGAGTWLECDRVYIRTFSKSALKKDKDFDSITWREIDPGKGKPKRNSRFWTKLSCCNNIWADRLKADSPRPSSTPTHSRPYIPRPL